jgi:hypothetical protein
MKTRPVIVPAKPSRDRPVERTASVARDEDDEDDEDE